MFVWLKKVLKYNYIWNEQKIEDLPPDVRYDGWNRKAQYDKQIITRNPAAPKTSMQPQLPVVNQNLLKEDENSQKYKQEALRQAQLKAMNAKNDDLEFNRQLHETKMALEKEIHRQLVEQLTLRAQKKSVTPEQQALIEKLYLDLRLINPELAFATLKASASLNETQSPTHQIVAPVARSAVSAVAPSSGRSSAASGPPPPTMSGSSSGVVRATVPKPTHPQQQQQRLTPSQAESQTRSSANKMSKVKPPTKQ